jgi:hypothetical protein
MKRLLNVVVAAAVFSTALSARAQSKPASPHETVSATVDGATISITYGRPFTKSPRTGEVRKIWGKLVPYDKVWRTGADQATLLVTDKPILIGGIAVPAGTNSLYTLPTEAGAKLVINKQVGQWGTEYDAKQDLARVDLKKTALEKSVDQFTIAIENNAEGGGLLKLAWENTQFSVPFTVQK